MDAAFSVVDVGSYPREENGSYVCQVVFAGSDQEKIAAAKQMFCQYSGGAAGGYGAILK